MGKEYADSGMGLGKIIRKKYARKSQAGVDLHQ
jgi:hypothetical protein